MYLLYISIGSISAGVNSIRTVPTEGIYNMIEYNDFSTYPYKLILPSNKKRYVPLNNRVRKTATELTPCIHGARVAESAEGCGRSADKLIDFSVNLNPLDPPKLRKVLENAYKTIYSYPDNRYVSFRKAAADSLGVSPENIVPGNGSSELIRLFAETVIQPGDKVIIPSPTFGEYEFQSRFFGAEIEKIDHDDIMNIETDGCKAIFLCNPNNPTGELITHENILKLAKKCIESESFLFADEAFIELSYPDESIAKLAASNDFVFVLRSLTKTYSIPGLRAGFAVASSDFAKLLNALRIPWNLNSLALAAGEHLLKNNKTYLDKSRKLIKKERDWLTSRLALIRGFKPYPSDANFILVDARDFLINSSELTERMLRHDIIIRDCASLGLENHIRVAVRKRKDNIRLIKAFSAVISEWGSEIAEKEIGKALQSGVSARSRLDCEYYPCHFLGQDCTFCFCPFYPCENENTGGEFVKKSTGGKVWSCAKCVLLHKGETADRVLKALMAGKKIKEVWMLMEIDNRHA